MNDSVGWLEDLRHLRNLLFKSFNLFFNFFQIGTFFVGLGNNLTLFFVFLDQLIILNKLFKVACVVVYHLNFVNGILPKNLSKVLLELLLKALCGFIETNDRQRVGRWL